MRGTGVTQKAGLALLFLVTVANPMAIISVTVAAVLERDGRFLVVEEQTDEGVRINQPAGHLEAGESIISATQRETLEESAYRFEPRALL